MGKDASDGSVGTSGSVGTDRSVGTSRSCVAGDSSELGREEGVLGTGRGHSLKGRGGMYRARPEL